MEHESVKLNLMVGYQFNHRLELLHNNKPFINQTSGWLYSCNRHQSTTKEDYSSVVNICHVVNVYIYGQLISKYIVFETTSTDSVIIYSTCNQMSPLDMERPFAQMGPRKIWWNQRGSYWAEVHMDSGHCSVELVSGRFLVRTIYSTLFHQPNSLYSRLCSKEN